MFKFTNDNKKRKIMIEFSEEIVSRKNKNIMDNQRSDLDQQSEADTHNTKISDSGYSTGCSNSQSQRSGSSKSIHSNSGSSNSSGYEGLPTTSEEFPQPHSSKLSSKSKDHKKKKNKNQEMVSGSENKNIEEKSELNTSENTNASKKNTVIGSPHCLTNITNSASNIANKNFSNNISGGKTISLNCNNINGETVNKCEILHLAAVSQTLKCVKKMRGGSDGPLETDIESLEVRDANEIPDHLFDSFKRDGTLGPVAGQFCLAVSMQDGKVLYTTPSLTDSLGFPCDMWIGRSFIDFIHHKDRVAFANHITLGVAGPMISNSFPSKNYKTSSNTFFCSLRKYRGLKTTGFGVKDKAVEYVPFKLYLSFKEVKGEISDTLLVITATTVKTAYTRPNEIQDAPKFVTRHLANTLLSHVDIEAVSYLGYLPQDMIGRSVFDFYHPEDMPLLKEIYESVLEVQGTPYRGKPYRFRTQNGEYVLLETEWSSFINPWSNKLEFTIGLHRLLRGPLNPDVFASPVEHHQISDEIMKENKIIQEEIKRILNEPVCRSSEFAKQQVSKKCKDLASFMESLMDRITRSERKKFEDFHVDQDVFSERDSVMLGEISPHHDYCDSKSSSETPPSYNQLNYNENLQRFFESKPRTLTSSDVKIHSSMEEEGKASPEVAVNSKCRSPINGSGTCSGSGSGLSSTSNCIIGTNSTETNASKQQDYCEPVTVLTEATLSRHNEDMEKVLIKRHRDLRVKDDKINKVRLKTVIEKLQDHCHGVKRSGSLSWEGDKVSKHRHTESNNQAIVKNSLNSNTDINRTEISIKKTNGVDSGDAHIYQQGGNNINLWPPFSVTTFNQSATAHATYTTGNGGVPVAGMIPIYYITTGGNPPLNPSNSPYSHNNLNISGHEVASNEKSDTTNPLLMGGNTFMHQVQFLNAFPVYSAVGFGTPSLMYSPLMMAPQAPLRPQTSKIKTENDSGPIFQRPASQATSVKAEPGSAIGSMVLSECSKKEEKSMGSPEIEDSLCFSQDEEKPKEISEVVRDMGTVTGDESSYSSYSSYLKTEDSMRSSEEADPGFSRKDGEWIKNEKDELQLRPLRKEPPWLQEINFTPELVFRYQLHSREITNVLDSDLQVLKATDQPKLVDDQLQQLYHDMELEGIPTQLKLEESPTASSCSSGEELQGTSFQKLNKKKKKKQHDYTQLVMIYEENMPLPSPRATAITN